ncbi:M48 family metalloprotease [Nonomuraea ceibae]|uniref:M48 family metalloprotease n=1 Tax=Nonomuraea ceibae TaxID=1935170 RepID=UPI001C5F5F11|nr:M48 family metalloprotease [Nonomuraea ceibae]
MTGRVPSATASAFVLLISLAFATTAIYRPGVFDRLSTHGSPVPPKVREACLLAALKGRDDPACEVLGRAADQDLRLGTLLCFATLVLLTGLQYWFGPAWRIRRRRLRPVAGEVHDELARMAQEVLGGRRVVFLLDVLNPAVAGLAFGRAGRSYAVISRGTWMLYERDRPLFRAVVLHELAHVRNRDLGITAVTLAMWRSYAAVILVPGLLAAVIGVLSGHAPFLRPLEMPFGSSVVLSWLFAAQIIGLAVLSWLTRSAVLQSRELMADARVLSWQEDATPLRRLFEDAPAPRRWPVSLRVRTHPHLAVRRAALDEPGPLVRQGFVFPVALGGCFSLTMDPAASFTALGRTNTLPWPAEVFALLLAVVLGLRALRAVEAPSDAVHVPLGLAVGLAGGWLLAPSRMTDHALAPFPVSVQLAGLVLLAVAGLLLGVWVRWVARVWAPRVRDLRSALAPLLLIAAVVTLTARTFYRVQSDIIIAHVQDYPAVSDPLAHVLISAQITLDSRLSTGALLLVAVVLLMLVPMAVRFTTLGEPRPPAPRRTGRVALAVGSAAAAALITVLVSGTVNAYVFQRPGTTLSDHLAVGAAFAAALAAVAAGLSRTSPVAKGMLAGLAGAVVHALVLELVVLPLRTALPWTIHMLILERMLEAALIAGLATALLTRLLPVRGEPAAAAAVPVAETPG